MGATIPLEKTTKILNQVEEKFGGYTIDPFGRMPLIGVWNDPKAKQRYIDEVQILELFVEDTMNIKKWFSSMKEIWRQELEQEEFLIIVQNAEIIP